jgi:hypothetical protein
MIPLQKPVQVYKPSDYEIALPIYILLAGNIISILVLAGLTQLVKKIIWTTLNYLDIIGFTYFSVI